MAHDPMDTHVDKDVFWAAYKALQQRGVSLADVRADTANRVAVAVLAQRTAHGMDRLSSLAADSDVRKSLVAELKTATPKMFTSVTKVALDDAVAAAAGVLSGA